MGQIGLFCVDDSVVCIRIEIGKKEKKREKKLKSFTHADADNRRD